MTDAPQAREGTRAPERKSHTCRDRFRAPRRSPDGHETMHRRTIPPHMALPWMCPALQKHLRAGDGEYSLDADVQPARARSFSPELPRF